MTLESRKTAARAWLGPDAAVGFVAAIVLFAIIIVRRGRLEIFSSSILLPLACILIMVVYAFVRHARSGGRFAMGAELLRTARCWGSLVFMVFVYENLRSGLDQSDVNRIDDWLMEVDIAMFGVEPTVWLQRWYHPLATDIMAMIYATYFVMPVVVMFLLYVKDNMREFRVLMTAIIITLALGYIGYLAFPASPPRFSIIDRFTDPVVLKGLFFHNTVQEMWDKASTSSHFCAFPSLHVGLSGTGMVWAFAYWRKLPGRWWTVGVLTFVTLMLWFSTLYLRHHWFADIIAGWLVAAAASAGGWMLVRLWKHAGVGT